MAVKIRLARRGRKRMAIYDIVVAESKSPRDGKYIEKIGSYNPNIDPAKIVLQADRAVHWLMVGAQPSDTTRSIFSHEGIMLKKHLQVGVVKGMITQEAADAKFADWKVNKVSRVAGTADTKDQAKDRARQERLAAEQKVSAARAEAIASKYKVEEPVVEAPAEELPVAREAAVAEGEYFGATSSIRDSSTLYHRAVKEGFSASGAEEVDYVSASGNQPSELAPDTAEIPHFNELWDSIAKDIFSEQYDFLQWLLTPNDMLDQGLPLMLLADDNGDLGLLKRLLGRFEYGIMA